MEVIQYIQNNTFQFLNENLEVNKGTI